MAQQQFQFPAFHSYPPWFTYGPAFALLQHSDRKLNGACSCRLQPIKETRDRQSALWCELILQYCRALKVF